MRAWVSTTAHLAGGAFLLQLSFSQAQHSHALWWVTQNLHVPALSYHAWCFISWWHLHWMGCRGDCFCACLSLYQRPDLSITLLTFQQEMFFYSIPISAYDCRNLVVRARFVSTQAGLLQKVARASASPSSLCLWLDKKSLNHKSALKLPPQHLAGESHQHSSQLGHKRG